MNDQKDNDGLEEQAVAAEAPAEAGAALTEAVVASEDAEKKTVPTIATSEL